MHLKMLIRRRLGRPDDSRKMNRVCFVLWKMARGFIDSSTAAYFFYCRCSETFRWFSEFSLTRSPDNILIINSESCAEYDVDKNLRFAFNFPSKMRIICRRLNEFLRPSLSPPRLKSRRTLGTFVKSKKFEKERVTLREKDIFYPVRLGDIF